ncbi:MAG TPA: RDD family protein, partial [Candidatus Acidoferrum sp.]|nr:RDD family protein [Candidatus Acidoferrum sp.]
SGLAIIVRWLYFAYLESGEKQATWGKQVLGLYVTDLTGNPIGFGRASGRFFAKLISNLIPLAIGYIMAGFTERKQALHDMIAGCLVLRR